LAFNLAFGLLAVRFDYPDVLRLPTDEVLARFREGGSSLVLLWWAFAMTAVLLAPLVVLLGLSLSGADGALVVVGITVGVLAALVQSSVWSGGPSSFPISPARRPIRPPPRRGARRSTSSSRRSTAISASPSASTSGTC
jgi:hypothetical protein